MIIVGLVGGKGVIQGKQLQKHHQFKQIPKTVVLQKVILRTKKLKNLVLWYSLR